MKENFETSVYFGWFLETEHAQDPQKCVAYGQRNILTVVSSCFISFKQAYVHKMQYFKNKSVLAIWPVTGQDYKIPIIIIDRQSDILTIVIRVKH